MKSRMHYKMALVVLFILAICLLSAPALLAYTGTITDDFNGPSLNTALWTVGTSGGASVAQTSGQLQVNIPSSAPPVAFGGGVTSNFILVGDFDMRVDFSLLTWPANNGIRTSIGGASPVPVYEEVSRVGAGGGQSTEQYVTNFFTIIGAKYTSDLSGTLRLLRTGNLLTGFYLDSSDNWVTIAGLVNNSFLADIPIFIAAHSAPPFWGGQAALVAFDNFQVQYTGVENLVPIPSTYLLLGSGLIGIGLPWLRRRIKKS
ncbi:MAG: hypothetical protein M0P73_02000 [Syntrophobacterales bacterium]|nr:hypothetical protein [Syntrophobacterales bacterium]